MSWGMEDEINSLKYQIRKFEEFIKSDSSIAALFRVFDEKYGKKMIGNFKNVLSDKKE